MVVESKFVTIESETTKHLNIGFQVGANVELEGVKVVGINCFSQSTKKYSESLYDAAGNIMEQDFYVLDKSPVKCPGCGADAKARDRYDTNY